MSDDPYADWKARGWTHVTCSRCHGHGLVSGYGAFSHDFTGPDECGDCGGSGNLWRSAKGILAQYPGGPFRGREAA